MYNPRKTINKSVGDTQRDSIQNNISTMLNNPTDEFNANQAYLMEFAICIEEWRQLRYYGFDGSKENPEFFNQLWDICDIMVDMLSAKLDISTIDELDKSLMDIKEDIDGCFTQNTSGEMLIDRNQSKKVLVKIKSQYRRILSEIQKAGMLTKIHQDPRMAMMEMD